MCLRRWASCPKAVLTLQTKHLKGFSPVCTRMWIFSTDECEKVASQMGQAYGLSPVCLRWCTVSCDFCTNLAPQTAHWYGFSCRWMRRCWRRWPLKLALQILQTNAFWLRWRQFRCFCSESLRTNALPQISHTKSLCPWCRFRWFSRFVRLVNEEPHRSQMNGRTFRWVRWCCVSKLMRRNCLGHSGHLTRKHNKYSISLVFDGRESICGRKLVCHRPNILVLLKIQAVCFLTVTQTQLLVESQVCKIIESNIYVHTYCLFTTLDKIAIIIMGNVVNEALCSNERNIQVNFIHLLKKLFIRYSS